MAELLRSHGKPFILILILFFFFLFISFFIILCGSYLVYDRVCSSTQTLLPSSNRAPTLYRSAQSCSPPRLSGSMLPSQSPCYFSIISCSLQLFYQSRIPQPSSFHLRLLLLYQVGQSPVRPTSYFFSPRATCLVPCFR